MPILILAAIVFLGSALLGGMAGPSFGPFLREPTYEPTSRVCLDENTARNGIGAPAGIAASLTKVKRPERADFVRGQGWDLPVCANRPDRCSNHPDEADYILVATKTKVDPTIRLNPRIRTDPPSSDIQLLRYRLDVLVSNDPETQDQLKGRLFRSFCGDWCCDGTAATGCRLIGPDEPGPLPYLGTFHCDFLFYLEDLDEEGNPQIDEAGNLLQPNDVDPNLPKNGSLFSIYFRKDAQIPDKIKCTEETSKTPENIFGEGGMALAQVRQSGISWDGKEWLYRRDRTIKNKDVNPAAEPYPDPARGNNVIKDPMDGLSGEFEVFKNLAYPSSDKIIYLVPKGEFEQATKDVDQLMGINSKEFHLLDVVQPRGVRSLQLGTFFPPVAADWIKLWYDESKPAIYLYPDKDLLMSVKLNPAGYLTLSDPPYEPDGWQNFIAHPDGYITYNNKRYPHLFYEAKLQYFAIPAAGFVVEGKNLVSFFMDILPKMGLIDREIDEFIEYWMEKLSQNQPYYFVHFLDEQLIEYLEPLDLSHKPDVEIRMRAYFKPLEGPVSVTPQELPKPPKRQGFTLVEWGGILDE